MSARVGNRRLLSVLSVIYWIGALIASFAFMGEENRRRVAMSDPGSMDLDALTKAYVLAHDQSVGAFWAVMTAALILFAVIWAGLFAANWVIRGYRAPR